MVTKHIALLAASTLLFSACQTQSDGTDIGVATTQARLSDITHLPLGNAELYEEGGLLHATNMHTLADGVRSMYQPSVRWRAKVRWADGVSAIRMNSINSRLSGEDITSSLSRDRISDNAWIVRATFVSPSHTVKVYSGTTLVGSVRSDPQQPLQIEIDDEPTDDEEEDEFLVARYLPPVRNPVPMQQCFWKLGWSRDVVVVQGRTVLRGNRVELIEDPHESYGGFDEIQVLGNADVTYLSEEVVTE